jgi:hypothetical protein
MDSTRLCQTYLTQRKLQLWVEITKLYEIEDSLNTKVHTCIMEGTSLTKLISAPKFVVPPDDKPTVPPHS